MEVQFCIVTTSSRSTPNVIKILGLDYCCTSASVTLLSYNVEGLQPSLQRGGRKLSASAHTFAEQASWADMLGGHAGRA